MGTTRSMRYTSGVMLLSLGLTACGDAEFSGTASVRLQDKMRLIDAAHAVEIDTFGDVYISGSSRPGLKHVRGLSDILLYKYNKQGDLVWGRQLGGTSGANEFDRPTDIAVDSSTGDVYVSGFTTGAMFKNKHLGGRDAALIKYDYNGKMLWSRQFGTSGHDVATAAATDAFGAVYVVGYRDSVAGDEKANGARDMVVTKLNADGKQQWQQVIGSQFDDQAMDIVIDSDQDIYVAGFTYGQLGNKAFGGRDAVMLKLDTKGNVLWTRQSGSAGDDIATSLVAGDVGQFFVAGTSTGNLPQHTNAGKEDGWVAKYTSGGDEQWTKQFGNQYTNRVKSVRFDATARLVIVAGEQHMGRDQSQILISAFDASGQQQWVKGNKPTDKPAFDYVASAGYFEKTKELVVVGRAMSPKGSPTGDMLVAKYK